MAAPGKERIPHHTVHAHTLPSLQSTCGLVPARSIWHTVLSDGGERQTLENTTSELKMAELISTSVSEQLTSPRPVRL